MRPLLCVLLLLALPARAQSLMDEAFQAAQWAQLSSAGTAIRQTGLRRAAGDDALAALMRDLQAAETRVERLQGDLAAPGADGTRLAGEVVLAEAELAHLRATLARDFPQASALVAPEPLSLEDVRALLGPGEGMLVTFTGENDTYVWAITPDRAAWHRVGIGRVTLEDSVARIRGSLDLAMNLRAGKALRQDNRPRYPAFERTTAWLTYQELLAPLEDVLADVDHLYTVTDGPLTGLPLALLITDLDLSRGRDDDPATLRATGWLFQRHALTTLPSVESLAVIRALPPPAPDRLAMLGFGDPVFDGTLSNPAGAAVARSAGADPDSLRALAPLPETRGELLRLSAQLGAGPESLFLGAEATETRLRQAPLGRATVLVFATHGLLSGDLAGLAEPALVLTPPASPLPGDDGLLTASEIADLDLDADWVVLSACNTAGGDGRPDAEGLSGLGRAFLFAGARTILVSHWPVRDDVAARLTTGTFARLEPAGGPGARSRALQASMAAILADPRDPTLAHPAAWAPFVLVGAGG